MIRVHEMFLARCRRPQQTTFHRGYGRTEDLISSTGQKRQSICAESDSELMRSLKNSQSIVFALSPSSWLHSSEFGNVEILYSAQMSFFSLQL